MNRNQTPRGLFCLLAFCSLLLRGEAAQQPHMWAARQAPLMTRWAAEVSPTNAHPEYPRPQLVRQDWLNLNGLWDYAITGRQPEAPTTYAGEILVPFPLESALSGVMTSLPESSTLWYRRTVVLPPQWQGRRVRLNFGAVDSQCRVFMNGKAVGQHRGGYEPFSFDITAHARWNGAEEIVVAVDDPTEGDQPKGKQTRTPEGIFYTSNSGIWQTVWLEPVAETCIDELRLTPDLDAKGVHLQVAVSTLDERVQVEAVALADGVEVGRSKGLPNTDLFMPLAQVKPWSPKDPFLYDLQVRLLAPTNNAERTEATVPGPSSTAAFTTADSVSSYFGLRKIALMMDEHGTRRLALNGQCTFQLGLLDQGFWPDGIYTAPTDAALRSDLEFAKQAGFNLIRKHVKVEPARWYYWCDKLGLLVWQDMPSAKNVTPEGRLAFERELFQMLRALHNHPSIILWVLFNEGWGQFDTERLTQAIKTDDPSRLVNNASGWTDTQVGDVVDTHSYPGPDAPEPEPRRASVLGEFGGLGYPLDGHSWSSNRWAYKNVADAAAFEAAYLRLLERVWTLHDLRGLSAAVYTQLSDVETECNGLLTYDRQVAKLPAAVIARANSTSRRSASLRMVVADAQQAAIRWRYTLQQPAPGWEQPTFDASGWAEGLSGFGTAGTPGAKVTTVWNTANIWMRREFTLTQEDLRMLKLHVHHDEDAEIYLNGVLAAKLPEFTTGYETFEIEPEAVRTLRPGLNTLAVHCRQKTGGQFIDVGLVAAARE